MSNFRFTEDERAAFVEEVARVLFVQYGMRDAAGVALAATSGPGRAQANGVARDLAIFIEDTVTHHLNGLPEHLARKV